MFEQTFKNIDDVLWKEAGCATELDYTRSGRATTRVRQLPADRCENQDASMSGRRISEFPLMWSAHWSGSIKRSMEA